MTTLRLATADQKLLFLEKPVLATGDVNSVEIHVDFDNSWDGYAKEAIFFTEKKRNPISVLIVDETCKVPAEVLDEVCCLCIGIRGTRSESTVKTTTLAKIKLSEGTPRGYASDIEPTPDMYQQILSAYGKTETEVIDIRARFEETLKRTYKNYDLLWENPDPTVNFESSEIVLGAETQAKYSDFLITYKTSKGVTKDACYIIVKNMHEYDGETITGTAGGYYADMSYLVTHSGTSSETLVEYSRPIYIETKNYIEFGDCKYFVDGESKIANSNLIPCKIYGIKQNVWTNVDDMVTAYLETVFVPTTQENYDAMVEAGTVDLNK